MLHSVAGLCCKLALTSPYMVNDCTDVFMPSLNQLSHSLLLMRSLSGHSFWHILLQRNLDVESAVALPKLVDHISDSGEALRLCFIREFNPNFIRDFIFLLKQEALEQRQEQHETLCMLPRCFVVLGV